MEKKLGQSHLEDISLDDPDAGLSDEERAAIVSIHFEKTIVIRAEAHMRTTGQEVVAEARPEVDTLGEYNPRP